jgi:hypothetical protein
MIRETGSGFVSHPSRNWSAKRREDALRVNPSRIGRETGFPSEVHPSRRRAFLRRRGSRPRLGPEAPRKFCLSLSRHVSQLRDTVFPRLGRHGLWWENLCQVSVAWPRRFRTQVDRRSVMARNRARMTLQAICPALAGRSLEGRNASVESNGESLGPMYERTVARLLVISAQRWGLDKHGICDQGRVRPEWTFAKWGVSPSHTQPRTPSRGVIAHRRRTTVAV